MNEQSPNEQSPIDPQTGRPVPPSSQPGDTTPLNLGPAQAPRYVPPAPAPSPAPSPAEQTSVRPPLADSPEHTAILGQPWDAQQAQNQAAQNQTAQHSPYSQQSVPPALGLQHPQAAAPKRGRGGAVGLLVGALVLGGLAGFGGAAAFQATQDDDATGATTGATSNVIDQGKSSGAAGSVEAVASKVLPSVVQIEVAGASGSGTGSGIILSADGRILTNNHVVDGAGEDANLRVLFTDGTRANAKILGTDPLTDTAVIQAEDVSGLTPATIGKSSNLQVGQQVVAIGAPYGLSATVTSGIVSALDRPVNVGSTDTQGNSTTYPAIQTDAAINPGNSGGPLVDMTGSVVGINSSIRTTGNGSESAGSIGLGFAIPMDPMMAIVDQMSKGETPTHARLGITVSDPESDSAGIGALVREVSDESAAGKAGLKSEDVITKVDDHLIDSADDLVATVRTYRPGDKATITYLRGGEEATTTITLDSDADTAASTPKDETAGNSGQGQNEGGGQDQRGQEPGTGGLGSLPWNR